MTVTLVAAVARNGVIGAGGDIPWQLPGEQKRFKELTIGHVLVMGRLTYESIGRPLPGRTTIVVTRQLSWQPTGQPAGQPAGQPGSDSPDSVRVVGSVREALALAASIDREVFVAGGAQVYAEALPAADRLQITWVDAEPPGDTFFPQVDWSEWRETGTEQHVGWRLVGYDRTPTR